MQRERHSDPVYLGYAEEYEESRLYQLRSCFFPLGKVGGQPSWLNPVKLPSTADVTCKVCSAPMCFLLQVYATAEKDAIHSFHRSLFFFICRNAKCNKVNDASNMAVFRCCLPRTNDFYPDSNPPDPSLLSEEECPPSHPDAAPLCSVCGCLATKRCAKCTRAWYCSRDHQVIDWKGGHSSSCGSTQHQTTANTFTFPEMGMDLEREDLPASILEDSDEDDDEEADEVEQKRLAEYANVVKAQKLDKGNAEGEEIDEPEEKDKFFERFNRVVSLYPEQILRYQRGGTPLIATDKGGLEMESLVSRCPLCSGGRHFEMQLMPHLVSLIGVDQVGDSIDWASVYVFTCSANCAIPDYGYSPEELVKQDFT